MYVPKKIILDTNVFLLYLIGMIAPHKIKTIGSDLALIICPNITTEVDNLLNNTFHGSDKEK